MKRVLVIGGGSIGERHVRCFGRTGRAEVALCEIHDELRERVTQEYDLVASYASFDEAISNPFDLAVICTPAHLHIPMAEQLAQRDVSLFIEKPVSVSLDQTAELQQVVEARGLHVGVAYTYRAHPGLAEMKAAIEAGRFGRPVEVIVQGGQHFPLYRPAYREIYYKDRATGGGAIQDALTHLVNAVEWLVGPMTRLAADAAHCVLEGVDVEDTVHLICRHGEVMGNFSLNQHQARNESTITVVGTEGVARFEMHTHRWLSCCELGGEWAVENEFQLERDDLFVRQAEAFLDVLEGKVKPACTLAEGIQTLRVNLAALKAVDEGCWVDV